ncbi:O-antigen ligase family protein [Chthonobacter rhizosphaerae]|uniref:O-antigen ligase family protein n=1 Tax=Chthonobacter rhizosphaerae TaxID=2735553 RepID=UPI0015EF4576
MLITLLVLVSPIPFGSVPPLFGWLLGGAVGLTSLAYAAAIRFDADRLRIRPSAEPVVLGLMAMTIGLLLVQVAPLPLPASEDVRLASEALGRNVPSRISVDPAATALQAVRYGTYGLFTFLCLQVAARQDRARLLLEALFWIAVAHGLLALVSLYGLNDSFLGLPKWYFPGVATGTFFARNTLATFMALGAVAGAGLLALVVNKRGTRRLRLDAAPVILLYVTGLGILLATTFATVSRMGIVVAILGPLLVLGSLVHRTLVGFWQRVIALSAMFGVVLVVTATYADRLLLRVGSLEADGDLRWAAQRQTWELVLQRPWAGWGGGTFPIAFPLVRHAPLDPNANWTYTHSLYLELWSDLGLIVGSFPVLCVLVLARRALVGTVRSGTRWPYGMVAIAAVLVAGLHSVVDFSLQVPSVVLFFLALLAIGTAQAHSRSPR